MAVIECPAVPDSVFKDFLAHRAGVVSKDRMGFQTEFPSDPDDRFEVALDFALDNDELARLVDDEGDLVECGRQWAYELLRRAGRPYPGHEYGPSPDVTWRSPNPRPLSGSDIRAVAKSVVAEFPGLKIGPYARWRKEDGSFSFDVDRTHSTRVITFGWIEPGEFYAVPMEDEYRGQMWEIGNVHSKDELAAFLRDMVLEEAEWLGVEAPGKRSANTGMRRLSAKASRKANLLAMPPLRAR